MPKNGNKGGIKWNNPIHWAALIVCLVGVVGLLGWFGVISLAGAQAGQGAEPTTTSGGGGICEADDSSAIYVKAKYFDTTTSAYSQVATNAYVYRVGETTASLSGTTNTTADTNLGNLNCGQVATLYVGDSGTTYYNVKTDISNSDTSLANTYKDVVLKRSSAATHTFSNTSAMGQSAVNVAIGSGETNHDVTMRVKAGANYYGDSKFEVCAQFQSGNITKVSFGGTASPIANDPSISVGTGYLMNCYEVTADFNNYETIDLPVVIQAKSGVNPASTNVTISTNDYGSRIKDGQLVFGYVNSDTNADLGLAVVTSSNAVVIS